ncbi:MAG TPA: glycosyltransferase [Firmicutes bacterium]|nr:glycosyltransferase [Bacillota bacterium]
MLKVLKCDMHVHSVYSERPGEWILKTLGTKESYTEPLRLYEKAKAEGMDFVTITDHNRIDGVMLLKEHYPDDVFTGVEVTTYFPEDNCKIHLLCYDFTPEQFIRIDKLRSDIYHLKEYLCRENILTSVAHATYSLNNKLKAWHLERLLLLFNIFETVNGGRGLYGNQTWQEILMNLTPEHFIRLEKKHKIEPIGRTPWVKGFTGGSDDHAGLFIAKTFTSAKADAKESFLKAVQERKGHGSGRMNDYRSFALALYKIGYDHVNQQKEGGKDLVLQKINQLIFNEKKESSKDRFLFKRVKKKYQKRNQKVMDILLRMGEGGRCHENGDVDAWMNHLYDALTELSDYYFESVVNSALRDLNRMDLITFIRKLSSSVFGVVLALPFLSSFRHMALERPLLESFKKDYIPEKAEGKKNILWFSDTLFDLNGVSVTLQKVAGLAKEKDLNLSIVTVKGTDETLPGDMGNVVEVPLLTAIRPEIYHTVELKLPSLLGALKVISQKASDEIIVSTPGPLGLFALLAARLLQIPVKGIYHTDFTAEFQKIIGDDPVLEIVKNYVRWFYHQMDEILVPTKEYMSLLVERGYHPHRLNLFKRGLDLRHFYPRETGENYLLNQYGVQGKYIFLYTGRISKDKNLNFLCRVFDDVSSLAEASLVFAGDGPDMEELKRRYKEKTNIYFIGPVKQQEMPNLYSSAHFFVFPSLTDTFGMSVLEAQACGLPAFVTDKGGPKQIVIDQKTGFTLPGEDLVIWVEAIMHGIHMLENPLSGYDILKKAAVERVRKQFDWENNLGTLFRTNTKRDDLKVFSK